MSVKITGEEQLLKKLDSIFGKQHLTEVTDRALKAGAKVFVTELRNQFETFKDTGASLDEITLSDPMWVDGKRTIKVYWKGPKDRYRIIHLNENGTINNPNPKGKGAIARAMSRSEQGFRAAMVEEMKKLTNG
jgi:HK97 gp10 family phage protein